MNNVFSAEALAGKAGVVTGAASGIGRATVRALVAAGASVVAVDIDEDGGHETVRLAGGTGTATFVRADVTDPASVSSMIEASFRHYGRLDFAHNNAGIDHAGPLLVDVSDDQWNRIIAVNLTGVFNCLKAEIARMLPAGSGSIVNTASALGLIASPGESAYIAAKHGIVGLTRAAAVEYAARGIRVNAVCPGAVETPLLAQSTAADPSLRSAMNRPTPSAASVSRTRSPTQWCGWSPTHPALSPASRSRSTVRQPRGDRAIGAGLRFTRRT